MRARIKKVSTSPSRAVYLKCMECSGDSAKEVTLCVVADCALWSNRFGYAIENRQYKKRMMKARETFGNEAVEAEKMVRERLEDCPLWLRNIAIESYRIEKKG